MAQPNKGSFLKSYAYWTTDTNAIPDAMMRGFNVVVVLDQEEMQFYPGCVCMSTLLPPPMLVIELNSSDLNDPNYPNVFRDYMMKYHEYLKSTAVEGSITNLLAAMYCTTHPTLIYTEMETDHQFHILESIHTLFMRYFGIKIGMFESFITNQNDPNTSPQFTMHPAFVFTIIDLLYLNGYIDANEYALKYPVDAQGREMFVPSQRACSRLLSKFNCVFTNLQSSLLAACNILHDIRQQAITGKMCPVVRLTEQLDAARMQEISSICAQAQNKFGRKNVLSSSSTAGTPPAVGTQQQPPQITR
jgi:hypothetical protein